MSSRELLLEAIGIAHRAVDRIEWSILEKSSELRVEVVSLANRLRDLYRYIAKLFEVIANKVPENLGGNSVVAHGSYFYTVIYPDRLVIVRNRPLHIVLSYVKNSDSIVVKTRYLKAIFKPNRFEAAIYNFKVELAIDNPEEYRSKSAELRYILREVGNVFERYIVPIAEARLGESIRY
ncbi:MAG: hypothetical protein ABWW65_07725 [Thermoprotei archaeon]